MRTKNVKAKTYKTQQNSKCRLCSDRYETINPIISECSKFVQKVFKTIQDWVEKVIYRELCNTFKFDHANKCYMHKPEPFMESETHKVLWDFEMQTDYLISTRRSDLVRANKKKKKKKRTS